MTITPDRTGQSLPLIVVAATDLPQLSESMPDLTLPPGLDPAQQAYLLKGIQGAANTAKAYASDLRQYRAYCSGVNQPALPASADLLGKYASYLANDRRRAFSTINRHLASISKWHELQGLVSPLRDRWLKATLEGISRQHGTMPRQARSFDIDVLKMICRSMTLEREEVPCLVALRDKLALLLGFLGAFRRSELTGLLVENIQFNDRGFTISSYGSKTNQHGAREDKGFIFSDDPLLCPVKLMHRWLALLNRTKGPLLVQIEKGNWLTDKPLGGVAIDRIVKRRVGTNYSAHSLRASFVTNSKLAGAQDSEIMRQTGHKTSAMIQRYTRLDSIMDHNAVSKIGW